MEVFRLIQRKEYGMSNWTNLLGFPSSKEQDSVDFYLFKNIPYTTRIVMYFLLMAVGFAIQIITIKPLPGVVFLIFATLLNIIKGCDGRVNIRNFGVSKDWTTVDMDRIIQVQKMDKRITKWKSDFLDITNGKGILGFMLTGVVIVVLSIFLNLFFRNFQIVKIFLIDVVILLLPLWFNGTKDAFRQNELNLKIPIVKKMEEYFQSIKREGENYKPALMLLKGKWGKSIPVDTRFTVSFDGMPSDFYGIQAQINLNNVGAVAYPYFYCVIPAKVGYGLKDYLNKIPKTKNIIVEFQVDQQAEVIVVRQNPNIGATGYHTKINDCKNIFQVTLEAARMILK